MAERLAADTLQQRAMLEGFDLVWQRLQTEQPSGVEGSRIVLDLLARRGRL
ncbi:hypothetical protein D3C72_2551800 [compost metagenome]